MVMQIKQTFESPTKGGFSDTRLRLFIFSFMTIGLLITPALGMVAAFSIIMLFGIFTAVKIAQFQSTNSRSIWLHCQAMDRMYHNSKDAQLIARRLADLDRRDARVRAEMDIVRAKRAEQALMAKDKKRTEVSGNLNLVLSR